MKANEKINKGFGLYETGAVLTFVVLTVLYFAPYLRVIRETSVPPSSFRESTQNDNDVNPPSGGSEYRTTPPL